jgi:hypothetical protein
MAASQASKSAVLKLQRAKMRLEYLRAALEQFGHTGLSSAVRVSTGRISLQHEHISWKEGSL